MVENKIQLKLNYKFWIETEANVSILGEGKWKLLKAIDETGSLKSATKKMGYSYRQTWDNLKHIEEKLGFQLIEKSRGGVDGGKTLLTTKGKSIVRFFDKLYQETESTIQLTFSRLLKELNQLLD